MFVLSHEFVSWTVTALVGMREQPTQNTAAQHSNRWVNAPLNCYNSDRIMTYIVYQ